MRTCNLILIIISMASCAPRAQQAEALALPRQLAAWADAFPSPEEAGGIRPFFDFVDAQLADSLASLRYRAELLKLILEQEAGWEAYSRAVTPGEIAMIDFQLGKPNPYRGQYANSLQQYYETRQLARAFDFTALNTEGDTVRISDFGAHVLYLDTWASWCPPCMQQLPYLHELAEAYADQPGFLIITLSFDRSVEAWRRALSRQPAHPNIVPLFIPGGMSSDYSDLYAISALPDYALLGRRLRVIDMEAGKPGSSPLREQINQALQEP